MPHRRPATDVGGAQAGHVRDEAAGHRAERHQPPAGHAVGAVDPAEHLVGHTLLAQRDRDDVPHRDQEAIAHLQRGQYQRVGREPDADVDDGQRAHGDEQRRYLAQAAGQPRIQQAAEDAAGGGPGQQHPVEAAVHLQRLGHQQDERGQPHRVAEAAHAKHDRNDAEQPVAEQPAESFGDAGPDRAVTGAVRRLLRQPGQQCRRSGERGRAEAEGHGRGRREQQAAERRPGELLTDRLHGVLVAVGPRQLLGPDQLREHRLRRIAEQDLAGAKPERGDREHGDIRPPDDHQQREGGDYAALENLGAPHQRRPVVPVDQHADRER